MRRLFVMSALALAALSLAPGARAQSNPITSPAANPTAAQIIDALKPTDKSLAGPTRGIRPLTPVIAAGEAAKPIVHGGSGGGATQIASTAAVAPSVSLHVLFQTGSSELTPEAMAVLNELGKALSSEALAGYRFRIEGHTDTVGSAEYNKALSERRAATVAAYLEHNFRLPAARLSTLGLGAEDLQVPTPPQTPEARNRRVQVINLGA
jgi:outer membrane protein OmpA-like peptidoglycan-associated protein